MQLFDIEFKGVEVSVNELIITRVSTPTFPKVFYGAKFNVNSLKPQLKVITLKIFIEIKICLITLSPNKVTQW